MSKQWGHGFQTGKAHGEYWAKLFADGEWEVKLSEINGRLLLITRALKQLDNTRAARTDSWLMCYVLTAVKELEKISDELPAAIPAYEFEKDIPK